MMQAAKNKMFLCGFIDIKGNDEEMLKPAECCF